MPRDLVDVMDVRPTDDGNRTFVTVARSDERRPVVEGSQMLGQAIVAAGRYAAGRRVVSASMIFLRAADARQPLRLELEELSSGRTFSGLAVQVFDRAATSAPPAPCCSTCPPTTSSGTLPTLRTCAGPYESEPYDMGVTGRDIRVVDGTYTNDPDAPAGRPTVDAWVRFRHLPDDQPLHAGLLAQFTGHMSIAAALRPHEGVSQDQAHFTLSMAINSISLSLHAPVKADDWLLYHHHSTFAGAGTTHAENRVYDLDGALVASFAVDAMVRPLPAGRQGPDGRPHRAVSLTTGRGPLSAKPAGRFTAASAGERVVHGAVPPAGQGDQGRAHVDRHRAGPAAAPARDSRRRWPSRPSDVDGLPTDDAPTPPAT